jgi:hypothetical protein
MSDTALRRRDQQLDFLLPEVLSDQRLALLPPIEELVKNWDVDWENFKLEYPWIEGDSSEWKDRLFAAIMK